MYIYNDIYVASAHFSLHQVAHDTQERQTPQIVDMLASQPVSHRSRTNDAHRATASNRPRKPSQPT